jgi:hypothetical protein
MMLAGLMTATVLGGIAPAYAQQGDNGGWRGRGGEHSERPDGGGQRGGGEARGQGGGQWRGGGEMRQQQAQRWEQRAQPAPQVAQPQPQPQPQPRPQPERQWRGNEGRPDQRGPATVTRWNRDQQRWDVTTRGDDRRDNRQDWRDNRRDDQRDGRDARRDDRRDDRWRNDGRRWNGGTAGRRFDDRTRWEGQRRWDSGWRNDRRYDWSSYRSRYGDRYRLGRYYAPRGWSYGYSRFSIGIFLNSLLYSNSYWIDDPYYYRLPPAYGTLRWVRYYDDALLVDVRDGYVVDVIYDFFW